METALRDRFDGVTGIYTGETTIENYTGIACVASIFRERSVSIQGIDLPGVRRDRVATVVQKPHFTFRMVEKSTRKLKGLIQ